MIKKVSVRAAALLFALFLLCAATLPVFAEVTDAYAITDDASVFDASQTQNLAARLKEAGEKTGWQFIVHTSNDGISSDEALERHYNNYYDRQGFKYDAIMLVIDRGSNKRDILVYGDVREYFKDKSRYESIKNAMRPYLNQDDMYSATLQFIDKAVEVHGMGKTSAFLLSLKKFGWIAGIAGAVVGVIFFLVNRSRYKNMGKAGTYDLTSNSKVDLHEVQDDYVTQHTTVRVIRTESSSSSGGGSSHSGGGNSSGGF